MKLKKVGMVIRVHGQSRTLLRQRRKIAAMSKESYVLSEIADEDLEDIFDYTTTEFGLEQAEKYLFEIEEVFQNLLINPELGKIRNEIKEGLYSFPKDNHIIFYRILENHIRIVRVLHGSRDIPKYF